MVHIAWYVVSLTGLGHGFVIMGLGFVIDLATMLTQLKVILFRSDGNGPTRGTAPRVL